MTHTIEAVWKKTSPELEQEITRFWVAEKALPNEAAAGQRAKQAVYIARNEHGELIAVCTVEPMLMPRLRQLMYFYRTFVASEHRGSKLIVPMGLAARTTLQDYTQALPAPECIGMVIEFENKGLGQSFEMLHEERSKFTFFGYSPKGLKMAISYFDGMKLQTPEQVKAAMQATGARVANSTRGGA